LTTLKIVIINVPDLHEAYIICLVHKTVGPKLSN